MSIMTKSLLALVVCMGVAGMAGSASAADCTIHYKRTACAGQEEASYKKCSGKSECDKAKDEAETEDACLKAALASCDNDRTDVTKSKVITATFKGTALTGGFAMDGKPDPKGANFCAADRADMNKCQ